MTSVGLGIGLWRSQST